MMGLGLSEFSTLEKNLGSCQCPDNTASVGPDGITWRVSVDREALNTGFWNSRI